MTDTNTDTLRSKKTLSLTGLILAAALSLSACNTVQGIGEDAQSAGEAVEEAAK